MSTHHRVMPTRIFFALTTAAVSAFAGASTAVAQPQDGPGSAQAAVLIPDSSIEHAADHGRRAHTNHQILLRPDFTGRSPGGETPASIRSVYNLPSAGG